MAKYDGLIIPRSYNDYINKSDPLGVLQALQLTGVMDDTPTAGSSKPVKSSGLVGLTAVDVVEIDNMHPVTSNAVAETAADLAPVDEVTLNNMHSVTSNAVANAINNTSSVLVPVTGHLGNMYLCKFGKVVYMSFSSDWTSLASGNNPNIATIPQGYRPIATCGLKEITTTNATLYINEDGSVNCYNYGSAITEATNGNYFACWITED